jgi:hypothetical protein
VKKKRVTPLLLIKSPGPTLPEKTAQAANISVFGASPPVNFLQSVFLDENDPFMAGLFDGRVFEV